MSKRKTTVEIYYNKRNHNKYIEVHNDGYSHNTVCQYIYSNGVKNLLGDRKFHRWKKKDLQELLKDYNKI